MRGIATALAAACASCAPLSANKPQFAQATPLCEAVMNEQKFAGQRVVVRGLLARSPHGRWIHSPECDRSAELLGSSSGWDRRSRRVVKGAFANDPRASVPVVVSGIFVPWTRYENGQPIIRAFGPAIDDARVLAARQP
ncbi:MAG TPA: hypothetical protein VEA61_09185 [Allosphingosinicella sp.]|nr:hypothetical protein [Allosphingosinicella sp.]